MTDVTSRTRSSRRRLTTKLILFLYLLSFSDLTLLSFFLGLLQNQPSLCNRRRVQQRCLQWQPDTCSEDGPCELESRESPNEDRIEKEMETLKARVKQRDAKYVLNAGADEGNDPPAVLQSIKRKRQEERREDG